MALIALCGLGQIAVQHHRVTHAMAHLVDGHHHHEGHQAHTNHGHQHAHDLDPEGDDDAKHCGLCDLALIIHGLSLPDAPTCGTDDSIDDRCFTQMPDTVIVAQAAPAVSARGPPQHG